jgi:membrane associated rhomboid family serine protease
MHNFWRAIPNGTRALVLTSVLGFLAVVAGGRLTGIDLAGWISLDRSAVASLQVWRLATYALIPGDLISAFFGTLFLVLIAPGVERVWSPGFFLGYFLACAAVSGLVLLWILGDSPAGLLTNSGAVLGLLVAWVQVNRHQRFLLFGGPEVSATAAAILTALFIVVPVALGCGWRLTPGVVAGAPAGWLFLRLRALLASRRVPRGSGTRSRVSRIEF